MYHLFKTANLRSPLTASRLKTIRDTKKPLREPRGVLRGRMYKSKCKLNMFEKAGLPGLEPRTTVPKTAVLPITP